MIVAYEAIDNEGRTRTSTMEASDERDAREQLRHQGLFVTRIVASKGDSVLKTQEKKSHHGKKGKLPLRVLTLLTRQLSMLLRAGSGLVPSLSAIAKQMQKPAHVAVIKEVIDELEDGRMLAEALKSQPRTFSPVYTAIVAAGEASGSLTEMLERLATIVGKARSLRKKIIGALAYPAVLMVMSFSIINVLLFFVVPRFNVMFTQLGVETPSVTKALLWVGATLQSHWILIVASIAFVIAASSVALMSDRGKQWLADVQIRIPIVGGLRRQLILAQVLRTMGVLIDSKVGVLETIELVRRSTRNSRFQQLFDGIEECVTSGQRVSTAFERSGVADPALCQAVHTGEDSGHLGESMLYCADMADESNEELITLVMKLMEPAILVVMGIVVGAVANALFIPLFDLTSAMR